MSAQKDDGMENGKDSTITYIKNLHDLVELAGRHLDNPVTIEAQNFKLMAYSSNQNVDFARQQTILEKQVPQLLAKQLKQEGILHQLESGTGAVRIRPFEDFGLSQRVAIAVRNGRQIYGYIWVQEINPLSENDFVLLKELSHQASQIISSQQSARKALSQSREHFFWRLIQGEFPNERALKREAEMIGIPLPSRFTFIVFQFPGDRIDDNARNWLRICCSYISKSTYWFERDEQIVVFVGSPSFINGSALQLAIELEQKIKSRVDCPLLHEGVGNEYAELTHAKNSYIEALEVIELSRKYKKENAPFPLTFKELGVFRLLNIIEEKNKQDGYINDNLLKLILYDQENQSDLLSTLEIYIQKNGNGKETAEFLHIHPNTMSYRLKKIIEITQINLDHFHERMMIYIDILLYRQKLS